MRVALCLSGHLRSFAATQLSIKTYLIDKLHADVFIHTWNYIGSKYHIDGGTIAVPTINMENQIKMWYKPIHITIENIKTDLGEKYRKYLVDKRCPNGIANMYYKIYMSDQLRQDYEYRNSFKYDLIIRARPDILFQSHIPEKEVLSSITDNCLYIPSYGHFDGLNDQFAFGNDLVMTKYSNCYNELDKWAPKIPFKPEPILKHHVMENKIPIKFSGVSYVIARANGQIFDNRIVSSGLPDLSKW